MIGWVDWSRQLTKTGHSAQNPCPAILSAMGILQQLTAESRNPRPGGVGHNPFAAHFSHVNEFSFTAQSAQVFGVEERLGQVAIEGDTRERQCSVAGWK